MIRMILVLTVLASPASAAEWQKLNDEEILQALVSRVLQYSNAIQNFFADGRTLYEEGQPSWGRWLVSGDRYCSVWPPSTEWTCYDLEQHERGLMLRFISDSGTITKGVYIDLN